MTDKNKKIKVLGEEAEQEIYQEKMDEQTEPLRPEDYLDGDKLYFKSEHIIPILRNMTPAQIEIFEHLTGINRQTLH